MTTVLQIQTIVAEHYGITVDQITGPRRFAGVTWPRQVAMFFVKKFTRNYDTNIGLMFNRTGSNVSYALKHVRNICQTEANIRRDLEALEEKLTAAIKKEAA